MSLHPKIRTLFSYQRLSYSAHSMKTLCIEYLNTFIQFTQVTSDTWNIVDSLTKNLNKQTQLQHSTSHSVNDTHLKLVLCYDAPSQAFLFQFSSGLFLYIYQYVTLLIQLSVWFSSCMPFLFSVRLLHLFSLSNLFISWMITTITKT